jgi:hypothetical protein
MLRHDRLMHCDPRGSCTMAGGAFTQAEASAARGKTKVFGVNLL